MGMYDDLRVLYPLPDGIPNDLEWQTKSLECALDNYEIREDGTLWHELYDTEDHSDPNAEGLLKFAGMWARVNERWVQDFPTKEIIFWAKWNGKWINFSAYYFQGVLKELHRLPDDA